MIAYGVGRDVALCTPSEGSARCPWGDQLTADTYPPAFPLSPSVGWVLLCLAVWGGSRQLRRWRQARYRQRQSELLFGRRSSAGGRQRARRTDSPARWRSPRPRPLAAAAVGLVVLALFEGPVGAVLATCVAAVTWRFLREEHEGARQERAALRQAAEQLPLTAELLAACLAAGSRPVDAVSAVGGSLGGPLSQRFLRACQELRMGAEPQVAWERVATVPGGQRLARCLARAEQSGAPAEAEMTRQAAELRADQRRAAAIRARRAGVLVTAPLGLCFLPAFLLAGLVPVVIGLGRTLL